MLYLHFMRRLGIIRTPNILNEFKFISLFKFICWRANHWKKQGITSSWSTRFNFNLFTSISLLNYFYLNLLFKSSRQCKNAVSWLCRSIVSRTKMLCSKKISLHLLVLSAHQGYFNQDTTFWHFQTRVQHTVNTI